MQSKVRRRKSFIIGGVRLKWGDILYLFIDLLLGGGEELLGLMESIFVFSGLVPTSPTGGRNIIPGEIHELLIWLFGEEGFFKEVNVEVSGFGRSRNSQGLEGTE